MVKKVRLKGYNLSSNENKKQKQKTHLISLLDDFDWSVDKGTFYFTASFIFTTGSFICSPLVIFLISY